MITKELIEAASERHANKMADRGGDGIYHESYQVELTGVVVRGETYEFREFLKAAGFTWDSERKEWYLKAANTAANRLLGALTELRREQEKARYARWGEDSERPAFPWDKKYRAEFPAAYLEIGYYC